MNNAVVRVDVRHAPRYTPAYAQRTQMTGRPTGMRTALGLLNLGAWIWALTGMLPH